MENEGMVSKSEAVLMVEPRHLDQLLHPMFEGACSCDCAGGCSGCYLPVSAVQRTWPSSRLCHNT